MDSPLISVFLPYYNDEKYLKQSIESVLNQSYKNWELVLLNHATTDNCRDIAHSYKDNRIKHIDMEYNLGYGGGGILVKEFLKVARGKYIKFLCADDFLFPNALEDLVTYMENNSNIDFAFGNLEYCNEFSKSLKKTFFEGRKNFSVSNDEAKCIRLFSMGISFLPWGGSIVKRDIVNFDLDTTSIMMFDMTFWLQLLCRGYKIGYLETIIGAYRIHNGQLSSTKKEKLALHFSKYETCSFWKHFLELKDLDLIKKVWCRSELVQKLDNIDDAPFVICTELMKRFPPASMYLQNILMDDKARVYYEKKYNYSVREYRESIFKLLKSNNGTKDKIYAKKPKNLSLSDLFWLGSRKLFNYLTLKSLINRINKKKQLSL